MPMLSLLDAKQVQAMTKDETMVFLQLGLMEKHLDGAKEGHLDRELREASFLYQVLVKRLEVFSPKSKFTIPLLSFISTICDRPGTIVMWAYTLHMMASTLPTPRTVTLEDLAKVFPMGFPTEKEYDRIWDGQKGPKGQNLLDLEETWSV